MCHFKSAIVIENGDILHSDWIDSHSDFLDLFGLKDHSPESPRFVRIEFVPNGEYHEVDQYVLNVDQDVTPLWWDDAMKASVTEKMRNLIEKMIVRDERKILVGGAFIIWGNAKVGKVLTSRILAVSDSAQIESVSGSTQIGSVSGSTQIGSVCDSAQIGSVSGSTRIGSVCDFARIGSVSDSAQIESVSGSAQIGSVSGSTQIGSVCDSARIVHDYRRKEA